jgi:preprotein translocase subunit SecD
LLLDKRYSIKIEAAACFYHKKRLTKEDMTMKGKGIVMLLFMVVVLVGLGFISYYGIGEENTLGVSNIKQGLDLSGGVHIVYEADKDTVTNEEMASAVSLIQGRLDWNNWTEAEVAQEGEKRLRVDIPGVENAEDAIKEIGQTAQLMFVDESGKVLLTGDMVANAAKEVGATKKGGMSEPYVALEFTKEGTELFAKATSENIGKPIGIVLDTEMISSPVVNSAITDGKAMITGNFTPEEAEKLAALIRAGSLPFNLKVLQMENVGARLGADALSTGLKAGVVGIALVLIFMLVMYKVLGLAADWALMIYIFLELIALSLFHITLTLPGIAGIVLSIGMAVDANVVIFERIKEELVAGRTLRLALEKGFSRALPAILDGNITTLIAAGVLFWLGTGTVRGFAQTLMIGIVISMFTALFVTRIILKGLIAAGMNNPKFFGLRVK